MPSLSGGDEPFRARSSEWLCGLLVVQLDEVQNRCLQILDGIVDAGLEPASGKLSEEALDGVHPRAGGRCEVKGPSAMALRTVHDGLMLVGINGHPKLPLVGAQK